MNEELIRQIYIAHFSKSGFSDREFINDFSSNKKFRDQIYQKYFSDSGTPDEFERDFMGTPVPSKTKKKDTELEKMYKDPMALNKVPFATPKQQAKEKIDKRAVAEEEEIDNSSLGDISVESINKERSSNPLYLTPSEGRKAERQANYDKAKSTRESLEKAYSYLTPYERELRLKRSREDEEKAKFYLDVSDDIVSLKDRMDFRRKELIKNQKEYIETGTPSLMPTISPEGVFIGSDTYSRKSKNKYDVNEELIKEFAPQLRDKTDEEISILFKGYDYVREGKKQVEEAKAIWKKKAKENQAILDRKYIDKNPSDPYNPGIMQEIRDKQKAAADEIIEKGYLSRQLSTTIDIKETIVKNSEKKIRDIINNEVIWKGWNDWADYVENANAGGKRDSAYEEMMKPYIADANNPQTELGKAYSIYIKDAEKLNDSYDKYRSLSARFKKAKIAESFKTAALANFEDKYEKQGDFAKGIYNTIATVYGGIERNFIDTPANIAYALAERLGSEWGAKKLYEASVSDDISITGQMPDKFNRPISEKKTTFSYGGELYTVGYDDKGNVTGYYDSLDDRKVQFLADPLSEDEKKDLFKKSEWDINYKTALKEGTKAGMDIIGTLAFTKGAGNLLKLAPEALQGARSSEFIGSFLQYADDNLINDIRKGMPFNKAFAHSTLSTAVSSMTEIINPMIGELSGVGKINVPRAMRSEIDDLLVAIGKRKVTTLQAIGKAAITLVKNPLEENFEESLDAVLQPGVNLLANAYLNGEFEGKDVELPSLRDHRDTWITTTIATIGSAGFSAAGVYNYMKSDAYNDELKFRAFNPKNAVKIEEVVDRAIDKKLITHEEGNATKQAAVAVESIYKAFENINTQDPRVDRLKNSIIGESVDVEYLRQKITGHKELDVEVNALISEKTEKIQKSINVLGRLSRGVNISDDEMPQYPEENISDDKDKFTKISAFDFDGTLFDGNKLTPLGEQVKTRISNGEDIKIITARNPEDTQQIQDTLGISSDKISAVSVEQNKLATLDKLGINPEEYYDADKAKLDAIQNKEVINSNLYIQEIIDVDKGTSTYEIYDRNTHRPHSQDKFENIKDAEDKLNELISSNKSQSTISYTTDIGSEKTPDVSVSENPALRDVESTRTENDFSNENESYRIIVGDEAFNDILESGVVRTNADTKSKKEGGIDLGNRPTAFPSFSKGKASMSYANENPNHYIIVTEDASIQPSKVGRHGKGTTMFPTDESGNHLTELSGEKVKVYKHIGEGKYELVYKNGKQVKAVEELDGINSDKNALPFEKSSNKNSIEYQTPENNPLGINLKDFPANKNERINWIKAKMLKDGLLLYENEKGEPC